jgi:HEAT repeat protein
MKCKALVTLLFFASVRLAAAQTSDMGNGVQGRPLGQEIQSADHIFVAQIQAIDSINNILTFKKLTDLKGQYPTKKFRHQLTDGISKGEIANILRWAKSGQTAICFVEDSSSVRVCIGNFWYGCSIWNHEEPWDASTDLGDLPTTFAGSTKLLASHVQAILAGREVVVTAEQPDFLWPRAPLYRDWLHGRKRRQWRIKAGLKIKEHVLSVRSRDFAGWGPGSPEVVPALVRELKSKNSLARAEAAFDLGQLDKKAKPAQKALRSALHDADPYVRLQAAEALLRIDPEDKQAMKILIRSLNDKGLGIRTAAGGVLAELGPIAWPALPSVLAALNDDSAKVRRFAVYALGQIGREASMKDPWVPAAVRGLTTRIQKDPNPPVRAVAIRSLANYGLAAKGSLPTISRALMDQNLEVASNAVDCLTRFPEAAIPAFCAALQNGNCKVSRQLLRNLSEWGPKAKAAIPVLEKLLGHENSWVRCEAAAALCVIDPKGKGPLGLAVLFQLEGKSNVGRNARAFLINLGPQNEIAVQTISAWLPHRDKAVRLIAVQLLGRMGKAATAARPAIQQRLEDKSLAVRREAAIALGNLGALDVAVPFLAEALENGNGWDRTEILIALEHLGTKAELALPVLRRELRNKKGLERAWVASALWHIEKPLRRPGSLPDPRKKALDFLIERVGQSDAAAVATLARIGAPAHQAIPALIEALKNKETFMREGAANAIGKIGDRAKGVTSALETALSDENEVVQLSAAEALYTLNRRHKPAREYLMRCAKEEFPGPVVFRILDKLGPDAKDLVPMLKRALRHEDLGTYLEAVTGLKKIDPIAAKPWG